MEQQPQSSSSLFQLNIDAGNAGTLRSAGSWARILGILGVIFAILCIIGGVAIKSLVSSAGGYDDYYGRNRSTEMGANVAMVLCIVFGILILLGSIFAINFGSKISTALRTNDTVTLNRGFAALRNYFAFWSILMIIYLLLLIIGIATGSLSRLD